MSIRFDDSLPTLADVVSSHLGDQALHSGLTIRDTVGRLAFVSVEKVDAQVKERLESELRRALEVYARSDRIVADSNDYGMSEVLRESSIQTIVVGNRKIRLLDRRLVGADWLRIPAAAAPPPPRFVFASIKGGVGRSTALSVAAADFASHGERVLAIDMDMEAPGLGSMLLDDETLPEFGLIDALVENGLSPLDDAFFADLIGPSALADQRGRIDVLPAFGRRSLKNPGDILAKIARAYTDDIGSDGTVATILDQIQRLVDGFAKTMRYDAIMVDSRAGLHETNAAALIGLGAEVLLFGLNEHQTFQGYRALFGHLSRFARDGETPDWLNRLTMVQGRAPNREAQRGFAERCRTLFSEAGLLPQFAQSIGVPVPAEPFHNVPWDDDLPDEALNLEGQSLPSEPVAILEDTRFRLFDPAASRDLLSKEVYQSPYGDFIARLRAALPDAAERPI